MRPGIILSLVLVLTICSAGWVWAAPDAAEVGSGTKAATQPADTELIQLNFPENVEVKLLVDYVSRRLGMNILYDPSIGRKKITIICPTRIPKDSLLELLESILKMTGLALVDADQAGWKQVVENKNLLEIAKGFEPGAARLAGVKATTPVTRVFQLRHVRTTVVDQIVRPLLSKPGGNSFSLADRGLVIVTDYAGRLRRIASMIDLIDQPGLKANVRFVAIRHRSATDLATQVTALLGQKDAVVAGDGRKAPRKLMLTAEPLTNRIVIVSAAGAGAEALKLIETLDVPGGAETRRYKFRYISPERIDSLVRKLMAPEMLKRVCRSVIDAENGTMIVEAPPSVHKRIAALAKQLDVSPDTQTHTYRFLHVEPQRVEKLAKALMEPGAVKKTYRSTIDAASGLLIVTAPARMHERIASLKKELDVPEAVDQHSRVRFYKLMNTTAAEVLATISAMNTGDEGLVAVAGQEESPSSPKEAGKFTGPNKPPAPTGGQPAKPPSYKGAPVVTTQPVAAPSRATNTTGTKDAVVTADPNTNTIIVVGSPEVQRIYKQLISVLDKRRPQVMVEVIMATLDTSDNFSLGVQVARAGTIDDKGRYVVFSSFGLSNVDVDTGQLTITPGVGFNGALLSPDIADVVIKALTTNGRAKVMSAPKILVNDNATATLASISEAPFTSVNASDTVSTTSFAGYASAGTTVTVTPHISEGDHIQLTYSVTLNSFSGEGSAGIPPPRQTNNVSSEITIPDGCTVIVGGLTRRDISDTIAKVPILGDIPLLGYLFSSRTKNASESTLFVFIRPVVLRDDKFEDLKYLSSRERTTAQLPSEFPSSGPMIMQ